MKAWTLAWATAVSLVSSSAFAQAPLCYSLDRSFNISRGDIVLTTAKESLIKDLMSAIGQYYTHTGVATSRSNIRHNNMDDELIQRVAGSGLRVLPDRVKATGEKSLRDGSPGMKTTLLNDNGFKATTSLVLTGPLEYQAGRQRAATAIEGMDGYYRLYAYTDMSWAAPQKRSLDSGNMCSGSVAWANIRGGELPATTRISYAAEVRNGAANVLFNSVKKRVSKVIPEILARVAPKRADDLARNVANQVVNCMAFNDCGNIGDRWRKGVGPGSTISPDNLKDIMHAMWRAATLKGEKLSFPYQWVAPVEVKSPIYCCRTDATTFRCN